MGVGELLRISVNMLLEVNGIESAELCGVVAVGVIP